MGGGVGEERESDDDEDNDGAAFGIEFCVAGRFELGLTKKFEIQDICRHVIYPFLADNCSETPFLSTNGFAFEVYSVRKHVEHSVLDVIFGVDFSKESNADLYKFTSSKS